MAQLMPLPLTVSCFSKIQIGFTCLVLADLGSPGTTGVCVCLCQLLKVLKRTFTSWRTPWREVWSGKLFCFLKLNEVNILWAQFISTLQLIHVEHNAQIILYCYCQLCESMHFCLKHPLRFQSFESIKQTTHTHTHPFNGPLSGTTQVNRLLQLADGLFIKGGQ